MIKGVILVVALFLLLYVFSFFGIIGEVLFWITFAVIVIFFIWKIIQFFGNDVGTSVKFDRKNNGFTRDSGRHFTRHKKSN